jgi:hypothetical protein
MKKRMPVVAGVSFLVSFTALGPADLVSKLMIGLMGAFLCAGPLCILSMVGFVRSSSDCTRTLISVLVCMLSTPLLHCWRLGWREPSQHLELRPLTAGPCG